MITLRTVAAALAVVTLTACGTTPPSSPDTTTGSYYGTPSPSQTTAVTTPLTVFYISVGDAGRAGPAIGCGDSAVATSTGPIRHTDAVQPAVRALLANHSQYIGASGLRNALWQSRLTYRRHAMRGTTVVLYLDGTFRLGGVCDIPRVKAQLEYTAKRAAGAAHAIVYVGAQTLDQVLSQK